MILQVVLTALLARRKNQMVSHQDSQADGDNNTAAKGRALISNVGTTFILGVILGLSRDNGKENGNYHSGFRVYGIGTPDQRKPLLRALMLGSLI